jgi:hypothetical protein
MASPESLAARLINRGVRFLAIFCAAIAVGMLAAHSQAGWLRKPLRIPPEEAVRLGHAAFPLALAFFLLAAVSAAAWLRRSARLAFLSLALLVPAGVVGGLGVFEIIYASKSFQPLAQSLKSVPAETDLACVRCMPPGLSFYLNRIPILISKDGRELTSNYQLYFLAKNPWPADKVVPFDQFDDWVGSRQKPVYLVAQKQDRMLLEKLAAARNLQVADLPQGFFGLGLPATSKDEPPRRP